MKMLLLLLAFLAGLIVGWRATWWHHNRIWKRYPERFIWIAQQVIERREAREKAAS